MHTVAVLMACILLAVSTEAQTNNVVTAPVSSSSCSTSNTLVTIKGRTYQNYRITQVDPDGIYILHQSGIAKIPYEELPAGIQQQYGFDAKRAGFFREYQEDRQRHAARMAALREDQDRRRSELESKRVQGEQEAQAKRKEALVSARERERRIREGAVSVGMTKAEAIRAWGEPKQINREVWESHTTEQWVYGVGKYLYFDDGELTTIQYDLSP